MLLLLLYYYYYYYVGSLHCIIVHCLPLCSCFMFLCSVHSFVCLINFVYFLLIFVIDFVCTVFWYALCLSLYFFVLLILLLPLTTYLDDCCSLLTLQLLVGVSIQNIIYSIRFWILGGANDNFVVGRMYLIYSIKYWKIRKDRGNFCRRS